MKENASYSFMISGGGTGGHIFPAIAIGKALQKKYPDASIRFVGARDKMEMEKVPAAGFEIDGLWISGLSRKLSPQLFLFPIKVVASLIACLGLIRKHKPDVVIGVGGFASGPLLKAAQWMGVNTIIQEQNGFAGKTNKWLAQGAKKICVAFPDMEKFFPKDRIVLTGNPLRPQILDKQTREAGIRHFKLDPEKKTLLILGGSLGARTINEAVKLGLEKIKMANVQIIWQTGKFYKDQDEVIGLQTPFIQDMGHAYAAADLVISRAGASSISELAVLGKAVIFVPSPNVAEDHQTKNAEALTKTKAALMIKDSEARSTLVDKALEVIHQEVELTSLEKAILQHARPEATDSIVNEIESLLDED
jgi:UDP-N-acetylglucosamine--N-acetylmuramyl-(pentapeptide) pyrophosphoryl-undecaprenol N-acetylglucosamine transferase